MRGPPAGKIRILPRETRLVETGLAFADGVEALGPGQDVVVRFPIADGKGVARFRTARSWPW